MRFQHLGESALPVSRGAALHRRKSHDATRSLSLRRGILFLSACFALSAAGCGGGGSGSGGTGVVEPPRSAPNPVGLEFRTMDLGAPAQSDGVDYKTAEYMGHWGLERISADKAYQRGYFGAYRLE